MEKFKKTNLRSVHIGFIGAVVLLALVASSGLYAPAYGQLSSDDNMTSASSSAATAGNASTTENGTTTTTNATAPNATFAEFLSNIEQIRGHLDMALFNKESGNDTLAGNMYTIQLMKYMQALKSNW